MTSQNVSTSAPPPSAAPFRKLSEVLKQTFLSRATLYRLVQAGKFPNPVKLSERCVAFESAAVDRWISERISASAPTATHEAAADQARSQPCSRSRKAVGGAK